MCGGETGGDFGCPKCTNSILERKHGWVECKSTSFPGKVYYFHTMTRCSTWRRPVPRTTQLPRYKKLRGSWSFESPTEDQTVPTSLGVSGSGGESVVSSDTPSSDFELHARRMQIYLQKNTSYNLSVEYGRGEGLRDKLLECYKSAKSELKKKLKEKKKPQKKSANKPSAKTSKPPNQNPKPVKIIRECHGIKTISYDPIPRELPNDVKMPDLSETSIESFTFNQAIQGSEIFDKNNISPRQSRPEGVAAGHDSNFGRFVLKDLNLSESESGVDFSQS